MDYATVCKGISDFEAKLGPAEELQVDCLPSGLPESLVRVEWTTDDSVALTCVDVDGKELPRFTHPMRPIRCYAIPVRRSPRRVTLVPKP